MSSRQRRRLVQRTIPSINNENEDNNGNRSDSNDSSDEIHSSYSNHHTRNATSARRTYSKTVPTKSTSIAEKSNYYYFTFFY